MIGVDYTAFLIRDPATGNKGAAFAGESQDAITFTIGGCVTTTPITQVAEVCARRGWELTIETSVHLFGLSNVV
jgi:hypothetical protein